MNIAKWLNYDFTVYLHSGNWTEAAGLYVFAKLEPLGWRGLYIGKADSFRSRLPTHERWQEALALGATHVHALVVPNSNDRHQLEAALIQAYQPPLNVQLR